MMVSIVYICSKVNKEVDLFLVSLPGSFHLWLASPEARFLKGKFLWANWDVDELKAQAEFYEGSSTLEFGLVGWPFGEDKFKTTYMKFK